MIRRFRKPTRAQDRRAAALDIQWVVHMEIGGYREMGASEPRHCWVPSWMYPAAKPVAMCVHCRRIMTADGAHTRTCFGAGRP